MATEGHVVPSHQVLTPRASLVKLAYTKGCLSLVRVRLTAHCRDLQRLASCCTSTSPPVVVLAMLALTFIAKGLQAFAERLCRCANASMSQ
eukprot:549599-Amphidinium_carterae.1